MEWTPGSKIPYEGSGIEVRKTICSICNPVTHCGIDAYVKDGVIIKVEGTKENPHNEGTLCSKGAANRQYIYHPDRIKTPLMRKGERGSGQFEAISWDHALDTIAERLLEIKESTGPESVVFYAGYSKWFRPFLQRLAHNFGSPNYCSESSTCSKAAVLASRFNYGAAGAPDLKNSKCLLVWSSNPFYSSTPSARRIIEARERGLKIIEVGPLITPMTAHSDIHLRLRPGTSGALALAMANIIIEEGLYDRNFVENHTKGFDAYEAYVKEFPLSRAEEITGISGASILKAARLFATTKPAAIMTGPNATVHHTNGLQNHRALTALIGLTGNFDREGGNYVVPPSYIAPANGMVTRERKFAEPVPWEDMALPVGHDVHPAWCKATHEAQSMHVPFQIQSKRPYPVRAMVGFGMNYRMWSGSDAMRESLKKLDFMVDVDLFMTDTAKMSDIVLPACSSFERSEFKTYPQQFVIWTQPVIKPLGESRPDNDIIIDLASRLTPDDELMKQGQEACIDWIIEPTGLKVEELKKYPAGMHVKGVSMPPFRKFEKKGFPTPSGKMEFTSTFLEECGYDPLPRYVEPMQSPVSTPEIAKDFPLILTTGTRLPMYVHTRTFRLPWTRGLRPDPMVDIHPRDAGDREISQGDPVTLNTVRGSIEVKANLTEIVPPGVVNMYHGYSEADVNSLIDPDYRDPVSGYPGFKSLLCEVKKIS